VGIPNELYWELTQHEIAAVLELQTERQKIETRSADLRAGLVAATIHNVFRKKGSRPVRPIDFLQGPRRHMSVEDSKLVMDRWARSVSQGLPARGDKQ
jgi:hypothetical protein